MATRFVLIPEGAHYPFTASPEFRYVFGRPVLAFDANTDESCAFTVHAPQGLTGTLTATLNLFMASATTGNVEFEVQVEAVSPGDTTPNMGTATSFDTVNNGSVSVPGTAGHFFQIAVTLTNKDDIQPGDYVRISVARDADDATNDTATGDCYFLSLSLRDAA